MGKLPLPTVPDGEAAPLAWNDRFGAWTASGYEDVADLFRSPDFETVALGSRIGDLGERAGRPLKSLSELLSGVLFFRNGSDHYEARRFLKRALMEMGPLLGEAAVRGAVRSVLEEASQRREVDAVAEIAGRIPVSIISQAMEISESTARAVMQHGVGMIDAWQRLPLRIYAKLDAHSEKMFSIVEDEIARAQLSGASRLSRILAFGGSAKGLGLAEMTAAILFMIWAGLETTASFLSTILLVILHDGGSLARRIRDDPRLVANTIEEAGRLVPPIRQGNGRIARRRTSLGGLQLEAGSIVTPVIDRANRDPRMFPEPNQFRLDRMGPPSLTFGAGIHTCLGSYLAKLEARMLIEILLGEYTARLVDDAVEWETASRFSKLPSAMRRLKKLNLSVSPGSG